MRGEVIHSLYQALSRGSCRQITNGKANRMDAYLIHRDESVREGLQRVMPGLKWQQWAPQAAAAQGKAAEVAAVVRAYLDGLSVEREKVSIRELKSRTGMSDAPNGTWQRGLAHAIDGSRWSLEGRSLARAI
jgi:hypothetical protein